MVNVRFSPVHPNLHGTSFAVDATARKVFISVKRNDHPVATFPVDYDAFLSFCADCLTADQYADESKRHAD